MTSGTPAGRRPIVAVVRPGAYLLPVLPALMAVALRPSGRQLLLWSIGLTTLTVLIIGWRLWHQRATEGLRGVVRSVPVMALAAFLTCLAVPFPWWVGWGPVRGTGLLCGLLLGLLPRPGASQDQNAPPATRRSRLSARAWSRMGTLFLDGWMIGGSVLLMVSVFATSGLLHRAPGALWHRPAAWWSLTSLITVMIVGGLTGHVREQHRMAVGSRLASVVAILVADLVWAVSDDSTQSLRYSWVAVGILSGSLLVDGVGPVIASSVDWQRPRGLTLMQLPIPAAAVFLLTPGDRSQLSRGLAVSLMAGLFAQIVMHGRTNTTLWQRLLGQTEQFRDLVRDSRDVMIHLDAEGRVEFANDAVQEVYGFPARALIGRPLGELLHPDDRAGVLTIAALQERESDVTRVEARFRHADGTWRYCESVVSLRRDQPGWIISARDITERIRLRAKLAQQAATDPLTGLVNRQAFLRMLSERLTGPRSVVVLFIDLDGFKQVNDTLGHSSGDDLLRRVGARLQDTARPGDEVARLGGDEFAILLGSDDEESARMVGWLVVSVIAGIWGREASGHSISASVGIASGKRMSAQELLRDADLAMYRAKGNGGAQVVVFEDWMSELVLERSRTLAELEVATRDGALVVEMQPLVELESGHWVGFEALSRWRNGSQLRPPDQFVPLAEDTGLIVPMGEWVLEEALRQIRTWPDGDVGVAVNVSARQLEEPDFSGMVQRALESASFDPRRLTLEITEQTAVQDLSRAASRLQPLRRNGVHIALDDFGTGYSSLHYLTRLPADSLKIDKKFVSGLGVERQDEVLIRSMLLLAGDLGLEVVAEGVETPLQARILADLGCRLAQGYLFSPPRPLDDLLWMRPRHQVPDQRGARGVPQQHAEGTAAEPPNPVPNWLASSPGSRGQ